DTAPLLHRRLLPPNDFRADDRKRGEGRQYAVRNEGRYLTVMSPFMPAKSWSGQISRYLPALVGINSRSFCSPGCNKISVLSAFNTSGLPSSARLNNFAALNSCVSLPGFSR